MSEQQAGGPDRAPDDAPDRAPDGRDDRDHRSDDAPVQLRLRRAPKYVPFGVTGVAVGVVIGLVLAYGRPISGDYSQQTVAGYFAAILGLAGGLLGLGFAVLLERRRK